MYYANGSYYDPEVGVHVDAASISSIINNAFEVFGLDINGIMCDNILAYLPYVYSTFTTRELSANPLYDPDLNKPWWELAWNAVVAWFASVVQWFNDLDVGWKIGIGLALFALACIITALTAGLSGGAAAIAPALFKVFLDFAIGVVSAFAFTAISMAIMGDFSLETLEGAVADAIFWGGVFAFVSASVNAVKATVRTVSRVGSSASDSYQVFWSGGKDAQNAAEAFAKETGRTTLEMTKLGKETIQATKNMPWNNATKKIWQQASKTYVEKAVTSGQKAAHVFIKYSERFAQSVWCTIERPVLKKAGIKIIVHML